MSWRLQFARMHSLFRMGFGTQQKVAKFVRHREAQKLRCVHSLLFRRRLDVPIKNARIESPEKAFRGRPDPSQLPNYCCVGGRETRSA